VVVVVVAVSSLDPQAANDRAIKETPPARAAFAFFFSQARTNFSEIVSCFVEASIPFRNAPVEIIFMFLLHTKLLTDSRRDYSHLRKTKIALFSKVKIPQAFVKHLSNKMCCKAASSLPTSITYTGDVTRNMAFIKQFMIAGGYFI
jgi:hypothetical protein